MHPAIQQFIGDIQQKCPKLTTAELTEFAQYLSVQTLKAREIYRPADIVPPQMGFIAQGLIKGFYTDLDGNLHNIYFGAENAPVGDYLAFSRQTPSRYCLQAIEPCTVVNLSYADFCHSLDPFPRLERYYRLLAENGFYQYLQRTETLQSVDAASRYLAFVEQYPHLFERISLTDLSSYLGIQRQSLTRIRQRLGG